MPNVWTFGAEPEHGSRWRGTMTGTELLTVAQMREADARTIAAGTSGYALMLRAGEAVATAVARRAGDQVLVLCGPGNNGGDGLVAAALLRKRGVAVEVALLGSPQALAGDAALAAAEWGGPIFPLSEAKLDGASLV